jgi:hypothetical protein
VCASGPPHGNGHFPAVERNSSVHAINRQPSPVGLRVDQLARGWARHGRRVLEYRAPPAPGPAIPTLRSPDAADCQPGFPTRSTRAAAAAQGIPSARCRSVWSARSRRSVPNRRFLAAARSADGESPLPPQVGRLTWRPNVIERYAKRPASAAMNSKASERSAQRWPGPSWRPERCCSAGRESF